MAVIAASQRAGDGSVRVRSQHLQLGAVLLLALFVVLIAPFAYVWATGNVLSIGNDRLLGPNGRQPFLLKPGSLLGIPMVPAPAGPPQVTAEGQFTFIGHVSVGATARRIPLQFLEADTRSTGPTANTTRLHTEILVYPRNVPDFTAGPTPVVTLSGRLIWEGGGFTLMGPP
jgi:hypothetical protein